MSKIQIFIIDFNIKFLIEGEEECGSDNLENFVLNNKEKLENIFKSYLSETNKYLNEIN